MAEDWLADVRNYVADADETVVSAIVKYLGIALRDKDSSLVSFTDKNETDRVRENYLKKKLGLSQDDATLDAAIAAVGEQMKGDRTKNRVTVYYLLVQHFGLLGVFGGVSAAAGAARAAAAATPASSGGSDIDPAKTNGGASTVPIAAAGFTGASIAGVAAATAPTTPAPAPAAVPSPSAAVSHAAYSSGERDEPRGGIGWLAWLLLALLLLALLVFGLRYCSKQDGAVAPVGDETAISKTVAPVAGTSAQVVPAAIPQGAGVVAAECEGKPMLTIYFDTGKSLVSNDLSSAATAVKTYIDSNPTATLAVSGYNDPTGNAVANAELAKNRAQSVKAALEKLGIASDKVVLEKPAETTATGTDNAAARRVEVTVKG